jgi:hypothetical protein
VSTDDNAIYMSNVKLNCLHAKLVMSGNASLQRVKDQVAGRVLAWLLSVSVSISLVVSDRIDVLSIPSCIAIISVWPHCDTCARALVLHHTLTL